MFAAPMLTSADVNTLNVSASGSDSLTCGSATFPCASIQYAVNKARDGATIVTHGGVYKYDAASDDCGSIGIDAVVCIINKSVTLQGNNTVIDGEDQHRGIVIVRGGVDTPVVLTLSGYTVRRGLATPITMRGNDDLINAFGGGIYVENAGVILNNVTIENSHAQAQSATSAKGGSAGGGGMAILASSYDNSLSNVRLAGNRSSGGNSPTRGGSATGGALFVYQSNLTVSDSIFDSNIAAGGVTTGTADSDGGRSAAQGGAAQFASSKITLRRVTAKGNQALGGDVNGARGGIATGGAFMMGGEDSAKSPLIMMDSVVRENTARGGNSLNTTGSVTGGAAEGGGIHVNSASLSLVRTSVVGNIARGGDNVNIKGGAIGGGVFIQRQIASSGAFSAVNSVIASNKTQMGGGSTQGLGGGGAGIYVQGVNADLLHVTLANNEFSEDYMGGQAILLGDGSTYSTTVKLTNSIVSTHKNANGTAALHVKPGAVLTLTVNLMASNSLDTNIADAAASRGTIVGANTSIDTISASFIYPAAPNYDFHIAKSSTAINAAQGILTSNDIDGQPRPYGKAADLGADEYYEAAIYMPLIVSQYSP